MSLQLRSLLAGLLLLNACGHGNGSSPLAVIPSPALGGPAVAQTITAGITANAGLAQAAVGPDQRIWFTEVNANKLAAVTVAGVATQYALPAATKPRGITVGTDFNIWTGGNGSILRVAISGAFSAFALPGAQISALVVGPDNNIWFADSRNDTVGRITAGGALIAYPMPLGASPSGIATGSDGNLWVTDASGSILRVTTTGFVTQFTAGISAGGSPQKIVAATDGNLYFTEPFLNSSRSDHIGRISTSGAIVELGTLAPNTTPNDITTGKDGNLYFTEFGSKNIGRVSIPSGAISEIPLNIAQGRAIVNGPDNNLWVGALQTIYKVVY